MTPLINGVAYSWGQIILTILGAPIAGVSEIEYDDKQDIVDNYGAGNFVNSRGFGKVETSAKIKLSMEEVEALTNKAPGRRIQNIPEFDTIVTYLNPGGAVVRHVLKNCRFKNNNRKPKSGDTMIGVDIDLAVSHIEW